jgi:hypothetical protein
MEMNCWKQEERMRRSFCQQLWMKDGLGADASQLLMCVHEPVQWEWRHEDEIEDKHHSHRVLEEESLSSVDP